MNHLIDGYNVYINKKKIKSMLMYLFTFSENLQTLQVHCEAISEKLD